MSADSLVDTSDIIGFNMYAYCGNNPVARKDNTGNLWDIVFDVVSIVYSACEVIKNKSIINWLALAAGGSIAEFHVEWGETVTLGKTFNVFDIAKSVYIKIMEW